MHAAKQLHPTGLAERAKWSATKLVQDLRFKVLMKHVRVCVIANYPQDVYEGFQSSKAPHFLAPVSQSDRTCSVILKMFSLLMMALAV